KKNDYNSISNNGLTLISNYDDDLSSLFGDVILNNQIYQCKLTVNKKNGFITPYGIGLIEESFNLFRGENCDTGKNQRCIIYHNGICDTNGKSTQLDFNLRWEENDILTVTVNLVNYTFTVHNNRTNENRTIDNIPDNRFLI